MKYCPFCGATLLGGAASFCAECGKSIPTSPQAPEDESLERGIDAHREIPAKASDPSGFMPASARSKRSLGTGKQKKQQKQHHPHNKTSRIENSSEAFDRPEDGYDGYYNDVRTVDNGHDREGLDPELIKKILMVAGGAAFIIALAIIMMLLL